MKPSKKSAENTPPPFWTKPALPWFHLLPVDASAACDWLWGLEQAAATPVAARLIRGRKAQTLTAFYDEAAAALQFPYYFGENWDAFHDCLADLSWLKGDAVVLMLGDASLLLGKESAQVQPLADVLRTTADETNNRKKGPRPFHVVLQTPREHMGSVQDTWKAVGIEFAECS